MKVAILCGGRGTRLRDVSDTIPKPMVTVGGKPILWHIMKLYAHHGIKDFVLLLGHKGDVIREFFLNYSLQSVDVTIDLSLTGSERLIFHDRQSEDWSVTLAETGEHTMTGGRIWRARRYLEDADCFCLTYGDGVGDVDITALIAHHRAHGRTATLTGVYPPGRFGELTVTQGAVAAFNEKPQVAGGYINGGFFVFNRNFLNDYLDKSDDLVLELGPMAKLSEKRDLMVFQHDGFWQPMDTPREYSMLNDLWARGKAPWKVW
ncbi:MAG: glucose-1-phosphate cytidylyltransferase [Pseudomonadota bacterium]